jgi:putative transcriptional regulator
VSKKNRLIIKPFYYHLPFAVLFLLFLLFLLDRRFPSIDHPLIRKKRGVILPHVVGRCLLADLLRRAGMTQQELATRLGVPKQQINKYVNNRQQMSYKTAREIAYIINCSMEDLYEWVPVKKR